jgi:hypothetical protein
VYKPEEEVIDPQCEARLEDGSNLNALPFGAGNFMETKAQEAARNASLQYCCLDTFAMVKIWEKLKDTAKEMS